MIALILLALTWLVVIPWLVLSPPDFARQFRYRWVNRQVFRTIRAVTVKPAWLSREGVVGIGRLVEVPRDKTAVIAIVNRKSGGQVGAECLAVLKELLSGPQVIDVAECPDLPAVLRRFKGNIRFLVCGGDGTVQWVMNSAATPHPIAVMPLGTGNDLSRSFGWGGGVALSDMTRKTVAEYIYDCARASPRPLDRWFVQIEPFSAAAASSSSASSRTLTMMNYFSIGIDAEIAMSFHQERDQFPERFSSQSKNVLKYAIKGFEASFQGTPLDGAARVTGDGEELAIHPLWKGVIVSNVPCYQGGKDFWGPCDTKDSFTPVDAADGKLEVMGVAGTLHIGMCNIAFDTAHRVGQAKSIRLQLFREIAVQCDGEPWLQPPCVITFTHMGRYNMLARPVMQS